MIKNYITIAFRNFWRHRLFTLINVIGLSVGISAAVVIYLIVSYDFSFNSFYPDSDHIYRVVNTITLPTNTIYNGGVDGPMPDAVKNQLTGLRQTVPFYFIDDFALNRTGAVIQGTPLKFKYTPDMILADERYFDLFPYHWLAGSKASLNRPFTVVLTSSKASKYFPGLSYDQMLGKVVIYGDSIKTTVAGIVAEQQLHSDFNFNDFISYSTANNITVLSQDLDKKHWENLTPSSQLFVKLDNNTSVNKVEEQLNELLKKNIQAPPAGEKVRRAVSLEKLSDLHFDAQFSSYGGRTANKTTLHYLLAIAAFLLLLACINFINLNTAQSAQRAKEIGIRKTMGSSRTALIFQFLNETFLITLLAVIFSCLLTPYILYLFAGFIPAGVQVNFIHQPGLLLFLLTLTAIVSLVAGFYPAVVLSGYRPVITLNNKPSAYSGKTRDSFFRKSLTVTQFVIAQFFIMATIIVSKQVYYALHKDLGFKKNAILTVSTPFNQDASLRQVYLNSIKSLPQVGQVSVGGASPSSDNTHASQVTYRDGKNELKVQAQERFGDDNYIKVYGIKLLAGRNIQPEDFGKAFLINQKFARLLGFSEPQKALNTMLTYNGKATRVVGVVGDFYYRSLHSPIEPLVIVERKDNGFFSCILHIALKPQNTGDWQTAIAAMQDLFKKIYPDNDFEYQFFDEEIAKLYQSELQTMVLLRWAMGLSIFISCLGLLGLTVYTANQRTKEIGIRKVLGATVVHIIVLLSSETALLIGLAFLIVSPVAWWGMHKWIQSFADRTSVSWWIFASSCVGMLLIALLASGIQTMKAAQANPANSLKNE